MNLLRALYSVAVGSRDIAPTTGTPEWATDGNPLTVPSATVLPSYFINMIMAEIMAPILNAGITPDDTNWAQLLQAVGGVYQLGSPGFLCLPGLFTLNWATIEVPAGDTVTWTYAKQFQALPQIAWGNPGGTSTTGAYPANMNVRTGAATVAAGQVTNPNALASSYDCGALGR